MIIGQPKTLADVPDFTEPDLQQLYTQMAEALTSGTPMEVPAAMPIGQLITFAAMLKKRGEQIAALTARVDALEEPGGLTPSGLPKASDIDLTERPADFSLLDVLASGSPHE